jgi:hypothetical protein
MDKNKRKAEINVWKPQNEDEIIVESEGQKFIVHFEKCFGEAGQKLAKFDEFIVKKPKFEEYLAMNAGYINYFINKYDPENDLVMGYLKMKWLLDEKKKYPPLVVPDDGSISNVKNELQIFIDDIYHYFFSDRVCEKIKQMVEDNYLDDIESSESQYKSSKKYMKSLEFDNNHIKILLRISMGMKMICPIIHHYLLINRVRPTAVTEKKDENIIYYIYRPLFDLLTDPGINIFNKLYVYIDSKVYDSAYHNEKMFGQREVLGDDIALVTERFVKTRLIVDNMLKYMFNKTWNPKTGKYAENIVGFNKTITKQQLWYFTKETYGKTLTEMTNTRNSDGLSASDKMEMNLTKIDVGIVHMAEINMEKALDLLQKKIDVPISDEEIQYYRDYHYPSDFQVKMVRSVFADFFASYRDANLINRRAYNILIILLKKRLLLMAGNDANEFGCNTWLPYILTGNVSGRINNKPLRNAALNEEIISDPSYQYLVNEKYYELEQRKPGTIMEILSTMVNTKWTYVAYENQDMLGEPIMAPDRALIAETLIFLKMI